MKLNYAQLDAHLSKQLSPAYLLSGDELFLKHEASQAIRKAAKTAGMNERLRFIVETGFDWDELYTTLLSPSLFAEKRFIELDLRHGLPTKAGGEILQAYAKQPSADNILLVHLNKLEDKITKSPWYSALDKIGMSLVIWPLPHNQLPSWIMQRAKKYKLTVQPDAAKLLAEFTEGNLVAAAQCIEKLYLLKPTTAIDAALIQRVLTDESHFTVFDFVEHLLLGDKSRALHSLENLRLDGAEPVLILWGLTRELRLMADLAHLMKQGSTFDSLCQKYRIFFRRQAAVRRCLDRFSREDFWHFLQEAANLDRIIKGAGAGNLWNNLQLFCLRLS